MINSSYIAPGMQPRTSGYQVGRLRHRTRHSVSDPVCSCYREAPRGPAVQLRCCLHSHCGPAVQLRCCLHSHCGPAFQLRCCLHSHCTISALLSTAQHCSCLSELFKPHQRLCQLIATPYPAPLSNPYCINRVPNYRNNVFYCSS